MPGKSSPINHLERFKLHTFSNFCSSFVLITLSLGLPRLLSQSVYFSLIVTIQIGHVLDHYVQSADVIALRIDDGLEGRQLHGSLFSFLQALVFLLQSNTSLLDHRKLFSTD